MRSQIIGGVSGGFLGGITGILSQGNYEDKLRLEHPDWDERQIRKAVNIRKIKAAAIGSVIGGGLEVAGGYGYDQLPATSRKVPFGVKFKSPVQSTKNSLQRNSSNLAKKTGTVDHNIESRLPNTRGNHPITSKQPSEFEQLQKDRWNAGEAVLAHEKSMDYTRSDRKRSSSAYNDDPTYRQLLEYKRSLDLKAHRMKSFEDKKQFSIINYTVWFSSSDRVVCMFYDKGEGTDHLTKPCTLIEVPKIKQEFQDKAKRSHWRIVDLVVAQDMDEVDELIEEYE